jgi:uncharacterized integral membrane protein
MKNLELFLKTYQAHLPLILLMLGLCLAWTLIVRFRPKWLGFEGKTAWQAYLINVLILLVLVYKIYQNTDTSIDYPRAFDMHGNWLFVQGINEYEFKDSDTQERTYVKNDITIMLNKQGTEVARFNGVLSKIYNNKAFLNGLGTYSIVDLTTNEVLEVFTEHDIKDRAAKLTTEKIFSFEYSGSGAAFTVRTVRDNTFTYDALLNSKEAPDGYTLFTKPDKTPPMYPEKSSLFQPQIIGETNKGSTILLSYDDLEKNSFLVSAVDPSGNIIWSKHDGEISPSLAGKNFYHPECKANTLIDDQNIYFITQHYVVCLSLETGSLMWLFELS